MTIYTRAYSRIRVYVKLHWVLYIIIYAVKILKNVIQSEEFNTKESRRYNVLVLINHNQDL